MIGRTLSLRSRIFISMLFMILVSFLLTGIIAILHFQEKNEEYHQERLKRKEYAIESDINYFLRNRPELQESENLAQVFNDKICELSDIHSLDINIYGTNGQLAISNNMESFNRIQSSETLDPDILERVKEGERQFIQPIEDSSNVLMIYSVLHKDSGEPMAIMNMPYFESDRMPEQDLQFLKSLFTLYMLLFIAAALLAYFLSNYITQSLTVIAEKMRGIQLGKQMDPIVWKSADEIGDLVSEYNRMLLELQENAVKLAQSERNSAWKEMARQVAHEIKNPLTPMRLSVQMLQQNANPKKLDEFAHSMLDQIDTLSNIATAFSRFATMPEMQIERINLTAFLVRLGAAHTNITLDLPEEDIPVNADRDQLTRMLNNLIINSEQAIPKGREVKIVLRLSVKNDWAVLSVSDNGVGIPASRHNAIFDPSFTTKTSGMGLGLAMVRNIVESFEGTIRLSSKENIGTTFVIELPLEKVSKSENQNVT